MPIISGPVFPLGVDQFNAVANGNYYCVQRGQTGQGTQSSLGSFNTATPYIVFYNKSGPGGPSIYLDWITLVNTVSGTGGTSLQCAGELDFNGNRIVTIGGGDITQNIVNPNGNFANNSIAQVLGRPNSAVGKTSLRRLVFGMRELLGTNPAPGDTVTIKFGGNNGIHTLATSTINYSTTNVPQVVIPPMGVFMFNIWLPGPQTVAGSFIIEAGWIEA